jgi:RecA/RadA recombinase
MLKTSHFTSGLEMFRKRKFLPRLTTGDADLDSLLGGGIEPGQFCLFYGDKNSGVDHLIHQILVSCLLPYRDLGLNGRCVYANCGNYREDRTIFDSQLLCYMVKAAGLNPVVALDDIYTICSYSEDQEEQAYYELEKLLKKDPLVKLIAVHNIARLFIMKKRTPNKNSGKRIIRFQKVVGDLQQICAVNRLVFLASCRPVYKEQQKNIPNPEGGKYLSHKANVIVYFKKRKSRIVQACLVKHPNQKPKTIRLEKYSLDKVTKSLMLNIKEEMSKLKRTFRKELIDAGRKNAFDNLLHIWNSEKDALNYKRVPSILDILLLVAITDNRKTIEEIQNQLEILTSKLENVKSKLKNFKTS